MDAYLRGGRLRLGVISSWREVVLESRFRPRLSPPKASALCTVPGAVGPVQSLEFVPSCVLPITKVTERLVGEIWIVKNRAEEKGRVVPTASLPRTEGCGHCAGLPPSFCFLSGR